jgi:hypothetical protein
MCLNQMDYRNMSLVDLKKSAKGRRIKQYYIMKRHQLIQLLSMNEIPESYKIEKYTIHELREQAREKGVRGFWTLHRDQLVELLYPIESPKNEENSNKNQCPDNTNSNDVGSKVV